MGKINGIVLVQPPFVQLSGPYPAPYYLKSFLEKKGFPVTVRDHSIGLFERIFCRPGLEKIFRDASLRPFPGNGSGRDFREAASAAERFFSEKELWLSSIDRITAFLRGRDREWGHFLALANGGVPGGPRTDSFLAERNGEISAGEAEIFAALLIADMADFIAFTLDSGFGLIRYTPALEGSLNTGFRDFAVVQKGLDAYIMNSFYRPMLDEEWKLREIADLSKGLFLLGITVPFPGCLAGALVCAESAKERFGSSARTVAGGGFVNTELRFLDTPDFFDYFDYLSFDRGYGSLAAVLDSLESGGTSGKALYKTMYRFEGSVIGDSGTARESTAPEDAAAGTTFPDYSAVDFGPYLYSPDDTNPMHRLWSDGHWLKAYLAHGCYWHSCAFCDVTLDYIRNFVPVDGAALFTHLRDQAEKTGIRGIHFCDEAAPVSALREFALLNREAGLPLNFWGNIRFEKSFDPDTAALLAAGGLIAVSGGLELVSERGFKALGKGIDLEGAVKTCAAFKEAGILVHAYLIYGYWDEDEEELVNSAEILRQFFAAGLLDSAFWHKFVLTRHSRIYAEKTRGLHPGLKVKGEPARMDGIFALNDLSFEGEEQFDKYTGGLDTLLRAWMAGETEMSVESAFRFKVKTPSVPPDLTDGLIERYAKERDSAADALPGAGEKALFLGSLPGNRGGKYLSWRWRLGERKLKTRSGDEAEKTAALLARASRGNGLEGEEFFSSLERIAGSTGAEKGWKSLRKNGLVLYPASH